MVMLPCNRAAREIVAEFIAPPPERRKPILQPRAWLLTSPRRRIRAMVLR
jgi:hypothetical protein